MPPTPWGRSGPHQLPSPLSPGGGHVFFRRRPAWATGTPRASTPRAPLLGTLDCLNVPPFYSLGRQLWVSDVSLGRGPPGLCWERAKERRKRVGLHCSRLRRRRPGGEWARCWDGSEQQGRPPRAAGEPVGRRLSSSALNEIPGTATRRARAHGALEGGETGGSDCPAKAPRGSQGNLSLPVAPDPQTQYNKKVKSSPGFSYVYKGVLTVEAGGEKKRPRGC